jgi:glutamine synthetase
MEKAMTELASKVEQIERHNIHTVRMAYIDMQGVVRGKFVPASTFIELVEHGGGAYFCAATLCWDIQCDVIDGLSFSSWESGFEDLLAKPDLSTFRIVPWRDGTAMVLSDLFATDGEPLSFSPRTVLRNVIAEVEKEGFEPIMASELEFYLLSEANMPLYDGIHCYELFKGTEVEAVLFDIRNALVDMGIHIEASNVEYGPAQIEVNLRFTNALSAADETCMFKQCVKEVARNHGFRASFMPKIWQEQSGSGYHVNQSLRKTDGDGAFLTADEGMSDVMRHYLAGLVRYAPELYVLGAWSINAYKRQAPLSFAPTRLNWGMDNRTTAVRALLSGEETRLENRGASSDANPYLVFAGNLAAGLEGIRQGLEPPEAVVGNGYEPGMGEELPTSLADATALFASSQLARQYFGDAFVDGFITICEHEIAAYKSVVHQWERDRYLDVV